MADTIKKPTLESPERKIRMTLTSTNVKALEKGKSQESDMERREMIDS